MDSIEQRDCIIIGGGAAGLGAALVLGRARRRVLLVDAGMQSNRPAPHVGGLLGQDAVPPEALYALAAKQLAQLPSVEIRRDDVGEARRIRDGEFEIALRSGRTARAQRLLLTTGMDYVVPDLPGLADLWGDSVFHCPFCHGWEVRDRSIGVLGSDTANVDRALLARAWSDDVVLLANGEEPGGADRERLAAAGIPIAGRTVARLVHGLPTARVRPKLERIVFDDGTDLRREALLIQTPLRQRSEMIARLGVALTPGGMVEVDKEGQTSVRGVYAAGDVAGTIHQVSAAIAAGSAAAIWITRDLMIAGADGRS